MPLFYRTSAFADQQPLLVPILQIHSPTGTPGSSPFAGSLPNRWLQIASTTTANAAFVSGDTPSRSDLSERSGGLHNFIRFLEDWSSETTTDQTARISGSFIQYNKSSYDSASFYPVEQGLFDASAGLFYTLNTSNQASYLSGIATGFKYRGGISENRGSYYYPPVRAYGFDVALLSQSPDLFAQRFTVVSTARPNEYFREVNQDDPWIETLLCAAEASDGKGEAGATFTTAAIPARPSTCPSLPYPPIP